MREIIAEAMLVKGWSGLLPDPDSFMSYPQAVQDKMVAWNDAKILDESKRLDKLVDEMVRDSKRNSWFSFILNLMFFAGSMALFAITENPLSFGLLSVPGVSFVLNIAKEFKEKEHQRK